MRDRPNKVRVRLWEHIWYVLVTIFLVAASVLLPLFGLGNFIMKKSKPKTLLYIAAGLVIVMAAWGWYAYYSMVDLGDRRVSVIIEAGDSYGSVVDQVVAGGVVPSRVMLKYAGRFSGVDRRLTPGRYDFTGENSCWKVLQRLREADFLRLKLTVPEGAPIWRVASALAAVMELDSAEIVNLNSDPALLAELELPCLEGYLFPETYYFPWRTDARTIVKEMVAVFYEQTEPVWTDSLPLDMSRSDIVALASIIEAETRLASEREIVASVYVNRLSRNMKLDADPTVIYGLGGLDRPLWTRDLQRDTPYNTYLHKGLPPTPINSPGLAAIRAAVNPADTDFYFFVADNTGGHVFSRTNAEHNRARQRIKEASEGK